MEKKLKITKCEDKPGANGPFTRFFTSEGWMSCFNTETADFLKQSMNGSDVLVDIEEKPGTNKQTGQPMVYKNILKHLHHEQQLAVPTVKPGIVGIPFPGKTKGDDRTQTLIVRQCCIKAACEAYGPATPEEMTLAAETFEQWVLR